ncbi:MAG: protein kinase [Fuerstiella sp.]
MPPSSISQLLTDAGDGDQSAAKALFERCFERLCRVIRGRIVTQLQQRIDAEDVVLSAYRSFFVGLEESHFQVEKSSDLWGLLVTIAMRKLARAKERHFAAKRDLRCEVSDGPHSLATGNFNQQHFLFTTVLADELRSLLTTLSRRDRMIVENRLNGESIDYIANKVQCSTKTVQRVLKDLTQHETFDGDFSGADWETIIAGISVESDQTASCDLPSRLNAYSPGSVQLLKLVGFGGTSKVYEALDRQNNQAVAVKFLRRPLQQNDFAVSRFLKELELTANIQHPGILKIFGTGTTKAGHVFLVTELCKADLSRQPLPMPWRLAVHHCLEAAEAVQACHDIGLLHCDLKPANLLLSDADQTIVCDFGYARQMNLGLLLDVGLRGSLPWMAPEQLDSADANLSPATDVYGLGACLFELLTGQPPFGTGPVSKLVPLILSDHVVPSPRSLCPDIPLQLDHLCSSMLSRQLRLRPQSMTDVIQKLQSAL